MLKVYDHRSIDLYTMLLDFKITEADEQAQRPLTPDVNRQSSHRDITIYLGNPDIDKIYETLIERGGVISKPVITG